MNSETKIGSGINMLADRSYGDLLFSLPEGLRTFNIKGYTKYFEFK